MLLRVQDFCKPEVFIERLENALTLFASAAPAQVIHINGCQISFADRDTLNLVSVPGHGLHVFKTCAPMLLIEDVRKRGKGRR